MADSVTTRRERQKLKKRRRRQLVGAVVLVFCVIGLVSTVYFGSKLVSGYLSPTEDTTDFESLIAPIVSLDPAPFSSLDKADQSMLLEAAIWAALNYEDVSKYERDEYDSIILPAVDVDSYISKMYGPSHHIQHATFTDLDLEYVYDPATKCYTIPVTSQSGSYAPQIESVTTSGNTKILRVGYLQSSGSAAEAILAGKDTQTVVKYMEYVMLRDGGSYYLYAVRYPETEAKN